MVTPPDMSTPVTRAELREELAKYPTKVDLREELAKYPTKVDLREELAKYPTKVELREELTIFRAELRADFATKAELREELTIFRAELRADFATKAELREEIARLETRIGRLETNLDLWGGALLERLTTESNALRVEFNTEMARHVKSFEEFTQSMIVAINEPYRDLPPRVTRLENKVFAPKRKRR